MADLDDFFAKKDRKKKTTKKFTTTEEVAKKLEDFAAKKVEKQKKERVPEGDDSITQTQEQDEWKEFEEEKKDYTGLKIGNLTINANQDNTSVNQDLNTGEPSEGGEPGSDQERKTGPWKNIEQPQTDLVQEEAPPRPAPVERKPEPSGGIVSGGTYIPPSMRNHTPKPTTGTKSARLDLYNEENFPTLSKSGESKKNRSEGSFEMVQQHRASSYRQQMEQTKSTAGPRLNLGNRYNTLSSNDS